MSEAKPMKGRVARRQERVRAALVEAARVVMSAKGVEAATMSEIAAQADVGAGTIYNYFKSKDELAVAMLEDMMFDLAIRIEKTTKPFTDPAQIYAYGIRQVIETAITDSRWKPLLNRVEFITDALFRRMGPFAIRDLQQASAAGRFLVDDAPFIWRLATHAIVGVALAVHGGDVSASSVDKTIIRLLCMTGIGLQEAAELAARPCPPLAPE